MEHRSENYQAFHTVMLLATVFSMMAVSFFVLTFCARSVVLSTELLRQRIEVRSVSGLEDASKTLRVILDEEAHRAAEETYTSFQNELTAPGAPSYSGKEALAEYRRRYVARMERFCEEGNLETALSGKLAIPKGEIHIDTGEAVRFEPYFDEENDEMQGVALENVTLVYTYGDRYERKSVYEYDLALPEAVFYDGNDALFEYSLIGRKGIYFTGNTSSVVGNLFAGTHSPEEYRRAEAGYGERGIYGGINLLSTQLGIEADHVVSTGDINLKGSFAVFGTQEEPIEIYTGDIREVAGYFMHTDYTLNGEKHPRNGSVYEDAVAMMNVAEGRIGEINYFYDSDNDETYHGKYRKILTSTDVTLSGDFTGAVITSGNVIIEADCNVEGLVYAADRIYVQGNNNIVSNRDVMRRIIADESAANTEDPA